MSGTPRLPLKRFERSRFLMGDINNDGFADLLYVDLTRVYYWFNLQGVSWSEMYELKSVPYARGDTDVRLADMNGNGTRDLVWTTKVRRSDRTNYRYFDFVGKGRYPNLLTKIDNNMGLVTEITYKPVISDYIDAKRSGKPWELRLPIRMKLVSEVKLSDNISSNKIITKYTYRDGYYDGRDREFSGFRYTESHTMGDSSSPDQLIKEYFEVGCSEQMDRWHAEQKRSLRGCLLNREIYGLDGSPVQDKPYQIVKNRWVSTALDTVEEKDLLGRTRNRYIFFPYFAGTLNSSYERTDMPRHSAVGYEYDIKYGTRTRIIDYGEVTGWKEDDKLPNDLAQDDNKITEIKYAILDEAGKYLVLPCQIRETDGKGSVLSELENFYDGESFKGLAYGQVTKGRLHRVRQRVLTPEIWNKAYGDVNYIQFAGITMNEWIDVARYEYGSYGLLKAFMDAEGAKVLSVKYDSQNIFPKEVTNSMGHTLKVKHDYVAGDIKQYTDENGIETEFLYDKLSLLERVIRPGDSKDYPTQWYDYNLNIYRNQLAAGNPCPSPPYVTAWMRERPPEPKEKNADRKFPINPVDEKNTFVTRNFFDGMGRIVQTRKEASEGKVIVSGWTEYNAKGKPKTQYLPFFSAGFEYIQDEKSHTPGEKKISTKLFYDPLEQLIRVINPNGTYRKIVHLPWQTDYYDEEDVNTGGSHFNTPKETFQDSYGRLIKVTKYATKVKKSITTQYSYNLNDNLIEIIDATGKEANKRSVIYDLLGRRLRLFEPNTGTRIYFYDRNGNLIYRRNNKKQWIKYEYDAMNRLIKKYHLTGSSSKKVLSYIYDSGKGKNLIGRLSETEDLSGKIKYSYDKRGCVEWIERQLEDLKGKFVTKYSYDSMDRVIQIVYPNSKQTTVNYQYDEGNNLKSIPGYVSKITYNAKGQRSSILYDNVVLTEYNYDPQTFLLDTLSTTSKGGKTGDLQYLVYHYDKVGNILSIEDKTPQSGLDKYQYDALYRLTRAKSAGNVSFDITYEYDDIGNMIKKSDIASGTFQYDTDGRPHTLDSYGGVFLSYDANGNLEKTPELALHWDFEDRLVKVEKTDGTVANYAYDSDGARTMKQLTKSGKDNTIFYVDDIFEIRDGKEFIYIFDNQTRVARLDGSNNITFYHGDHLLNTQFLTNSNGSIYGERIVYDPYGQVEKGANTLADAVYTFGAKELDEVTGLYYYGVRYYDSVIGIWISADPLYVEELMGPNGEPYNENLYAYGDNNPVRFVDVDGMGTMDWFRRRTFNIISKIFGLTLGSGEEEILKPADYTRSAEERKLRRDTGGEERKKPEKRKPKPRGKSKGERARSRRIPPRETGSRSQAPRRSPGTSGRRVPPGRSGGFIRPGVIRGIGMGFIYGWIIKNYYDLIMAGTGRDLELREKYGDVFRMSREQVERLRLQRRERDAWESFEKEARKRGMTVEEFEQKMREAQERTRHEVKDYPTFKAY